MSYLLPGLILFFGVHSLPLFSTQRQALIDKFGRLPYLGLFSLLSLAGLWLMLHGYGRMVPTLWWTPFSFGRMLALALMLLAWILVIAAYLDTHIRDRLKHPMLMGVALWASVHLLANGDSRSTLIFAPFLIYSLVDMVLTCPRPKLLPRGVPRLRNDIIAVVAGLLVYMAVLHGHQALFGVAVVNPG